MATRQYIGARYVPKFADPIEWDINKSYESLTIVEYLNNSYTSKKTVPTGVEITNKEYWVLTGNYNAQVEEYRQSVMSNANVMNYGAKGDGVSDDTTSIKNTLVNNGFAYLPKGIYLISDTIELKNDMCIIGDNATLKLKTNSNCIMMKGDSISGAKIKGIILDEGVQNTQTTIISLTNCNKLVFEEVVINHQNGDTYEESGMIRGKNCNELYFINCNMSNSADECLYLTDCNKCEVIGGEYYNTPNGSSIAIRGNKNRVSDVYAHDCGGSVIILSGDDNVISNCILENSTQSNGLTFGHSPDTVNGGCISNCIIKGFKNRGIMLGTAYNVVVTNCTVDGITTQDTKYGISHSSGGNGCTISNCYVKHCGFGIVLSTNECANNCHIEDCNGGIYSVENDLIINGCVINKCGDGVLIEGSTNAITESCLINNCTNGVNYSNRGGYGFIKNCIIRKCNGNAILINHSQMCVCGNDVRNFGGSQPKGITYVSDTEIGYAFDNICSGVTNVIPSTITQNNNITS